jgi:hypothetical protein
VSQENRILLIPVMTLYCNSGDISRHSCVSFRLRAITVLNAIQVGCKPQEWLLEKLRWLNFQEYLVGSFKNIGGEKLAFPSRMTSAVPFRIRTAKTSTRSRR